MTAPPRTPNYVRFIVTGAILGFLVGALIAVSGDSAPDYSTGTQVSFFGVLCAGLGAMAAALVAVLVERRR